MIQDTEHDRAAVVSIRVFRLEPAVDSVDILSQIGYLGEENDLPGWMMVGELLAYHGAFHST